MTSDTVTILIAVGAFLMGGFVKGLVGIGLPMVAMPILVTTFTVPTAVTLTLVPIILSNIWQAAATGRLMPVIKRFWPLQVTLLVVLLPSSRLLVTLDNNVLLACAGAALVLSSIGLTLSQARPLPTQYQTVAAIAAGAIAGLLGGVSSLVGVPVIVYLASLHLDRKEFVSAVSVIYLGAVLPYSVSLFYQRVMTVDHVIASTLCAIPTMCGVAIASRMMRGRDRTIFRRLLLLCLVLMGVWMFMQGLLFVEG